MRAVRWNWLICGLVLVGAGGALLKYAWAMGRGLWWWAGAVALLAGVLLIRYGMHHPASPHRLLGELLLEKGWITEGQLAEALARQHHTSQLLGEILVEMGAISHMQLRNALKHQGRLARRREQG